MSKKNLLVVFVAITSITAIWGFRYTFSTKGHNILVDKELQEERAEGKGGIAEEASEAFEYDLMRLKDPHTGKIPDNIRARELAFVNSTMKTSSTSSLVYNPRGPFNIGGRTRALALDVDNESTIIAGGVTGGMWRSTDGGHSFTSTTPPGQLHSVTSVAQDKRPGKHNTWYFGTGEQYAVISASYAQGTGNGIYKSNDGGQSWQPLASTVASGLNYTYNKTGFNYVWKVLTDPTDLTHDVVFAAVVNGIYKSTDGGANWVPVLGLDTTQARTTYCDMVIAPSGIMYAYIDGTTTFSGFWRSSDHGDTWKKITPSGWPNSAGRAVLALTPQDENKLFIIANTPSIGKNNHSLWHYTYLSGDGSGTGGYWQNRSTYIPDYGCALIPGFKFGIYNSQDGYDMCLLVSPDDSNVVFLGGTNIFRSTDGFTSNNNYHWIGGYRCDSLHPSNYVYPGHHPDQHVMLFSPQHSYVMYSANDGGLFKTDDNTLDSITWVSLNNGYVNSQFYAVACEQGNTINDKIAGGMQDNGTYMTQNTDPSIPWRNVMYGDGGYAQIPQNKDYLILSWQQGKMMKVQLDANGNPINRVRMDPAGGAGYIFINPFILDPINNNRLYMAGGKYVYVETNLDSIAVTGVEKDPLSYGWTRIDISSIGNAISSGSISAITLSKADSTVLYYGTSGGAMYRLNNLFGTVTQTDITIPQGGGYVSSIWANPANPQEIIASFSSYGVVSIYHSINGGSTWESISGNLEQHPDGTGDGPAIFWITALDLQDSIVYFAATSVGLFSTSALNGDNTVWTQQGTNTIGNQIVDMVVTREYDGLVVVGSHGSGVFTTRYKNVSGIAQQNARPVKVTVSPNPFRDHVTFNYTLLQDEKVNVNIYSADGRLTATLNDNNHSAGAHTLQWNAGHSLPNGLYLYEIRAGDQRSTGKLILSH